MHARIRRPLQTGVLTLAMTTAAVGAHVLPAAAAGTCPAFTQVAAGTSHSVAVTAAGKVWTWGDNDYGQLGDGTSTSRSYPVEVPGLSGVTKVSAGWIYTLAIGAGGTVWGWGANGYGQLGDGSTTRRFKPVQAQGLSGIVEVANGTTHSLALSSSGTVYAWGYNEDGQLGDGTWVNRTSPQPVPGLPTIVDVAAGDNHSMAVGADGKVYAWGYNGNGQIGDGGFSAKSSPVVVGSLTRMRGVTGGFVDSLAWDARTVWSWGDNFYGQLGLGHTNDVQTPTVVSGAPAASSISAGDFHTMLLSTAGDVWTWGDNSRGAIGDGTSTQRNSPVKIASLTGATAVEAGGVHSLAVLGGAVRSFGGNASGQLGDGTTTQRNTPGTIACEAPAITSASHSPNAVTPGQTVTFSVGWTEPNAGQAARAVVCKTAAISTTGTCPGGAWATGASGAVSPATATFTPATTDVGSHGYWAFACDDTDVCSAAINGTFTVVDAECGDGLDNDGDRLGDYPLDPGCGSEVDDDESNVVEPVLTCDHTRQSGFFVLDGYAFVNDRESPTITIRITCTLKDEAGVAVATVTQSATGPVVAVAQAVPAPFVALSARCAVVEVTYQNQQSARIEDCVDLTV